MSTFVVTAYRWGQRNAHSYVVGAFDDFEAAKACAIAHVDYRGGKYGCEVVEAKPWSEDGDEDAGKQVFYAESPYYGMASDAGHFHPADLEKNRRPSPKPFTVRELQNRIGELERDATRQAKSIETLEACLGPAMQDTERLNWLEAHPLRAGIHGGSDDGATGTFWGCGSANMTLRETIDTISAMPSKG